MTKRIVLILVLALYTGGVMAIPISNADIVTVNGRQWAQPEMFGWADWDEVNAVCPNQICSGILNTSFRGPFVMDGWIWATMADATNLLNSYGASLTPEPGSEIREIDSDWAPAFFADGWRESQSAGFKLLEGIVADSECARAPSFPSLPPFPCELVIFDRIGVGREDRVGVYGQLTPYYTSGAWFYRDTIQIPAPATLTMFFMGLAGLGISRRKLAAKV